ncbi:MAG TPA: hypothetical protein PKY87_08925 [Terricaulis sp.]|nr:hypothetical protein [Terricaulis sp.]
MSADEAGKIWVSTAEAQLRLAEAGDKISQPVLTKYLNRFAEIPRRQSETDGRVTEIDLEALLAHRAANVRATDRRAKSPRRNAEAEELRLRERRAQAEYREFQLAERKGELMARAEVLRAVHGAGIALAQALQRTRHERDAALDAAKDVRAKAAALVEQDAKLQQAFADALKALGGAETTDDGDFGDTADASDGADAAEAA